MKTKPISYDKEVVRWQRGGQKKSFDQINRKKGGVNPIISNETPQSNDLFLANNPPIKERAMIITH